MGFVFSVTNQGQPAVNGTDYHSEFGRDLARQACDRQLYALKRSTVRAGILQAQIDQAQNLDDTMLACLCGRDLRWAVGAQLNGLGRIVGQGREVVSLSEEQWLRADDFIGAPDSAPAWVTGVATYGKRLAGDDEYRLRLYGKIAKNHTKHGSLPEVLWFVRQAFGIDCALQRIGPLEGLLLVRSNIPRYLIQELVHVFSDSRADQQYLLPLPAGARLVGLVLRPPNGFGPDMESGAVDVGEGVVVIRLLRVLDQVSAQADGRQQTPGQFGSVQ